MKTENMAAFSFRSTFYKGLADRAEKRLRMSLIRAGKPGNVTKMVEFLKT